MAGAASPREPFRPPEPVDEGVLASLRELAGDDREFLPRIVGEFLSHAERAVARLRRAASLRDATEMRLAAHGLKGSAGSLGARHLASLCAEVEAGVRSGTLDDVATAVEAIATEADRVHARLAPLAPAAPPQGERP